MNVRTSTITVAGWSAFLASLMFAACAAATGLPHSLAARVHGWPQWGGDRSDTRNAPYEQSLNPQTAPSLQLLWTYTSGGNISATPTVAGSAVYITDWGGNVIKLNRSTGAEVWRHKVSEYTGLATSLSRSSPALANSLVVIGDEASGTVMALRQDSGALVWKTVVNPHPAAIIAASPAVWNKRVYVGVSSTEEGLVAANPAYQPLFRGSFAALDLQTGAIVWQFNTVPEGYTGGSVWSSSAVVDPRRGSVYLTTGNNYTVPASVALCISMTSDPERQLACMAPDNYIDAIVALDLNNGQVKWGHRLQGGDTWNSSCSRSPAPPCPVPMGPDFDFGAGANLINASINGKVTQLVGAGQKSGMYWALAPKDGHLVWATQVGPADYRGGILWGSATDGQRIYVANANAVRLPVTLKPSGVSWNGGTWAALDAASGQILWQVAQTGTDLIDSAKPSTISAAMSVADGVVYAGSSSGDMVALDAASGNLLWKFASGGNVVDGPSIVDGTVYWGSGYARFGVGKGNNKLYAFSVP